jgi:hypothetical protein
MEKVRLLAYYLPQYHPIPENDEWWGKGFTEWTNVTKAKPLFKGHNQPILPGELGFYDLRLNDIQRKQSKLALENGIDGFIYYQYWFDDNKMLLEKPAEQMLAEKNIKIPFCFCWANETWKGIWHGMDNSKILIEQKYNGASGYTLYFNYLLPFFLDERYIKVDNKPMFHIYKIDDIPDVEIFFETFNNLAISTGFDGIYFVSTGNNLSDNLKDNDNIKGVVGLEMFHQMRYHAFFKFDERSLLGKFERFFIFRLKMFKSIGNSVGKRKKPLIIDYKKAINRMAIEYPHEKYISCIFPNWDNSARSGKKSLIFKNSNPENWKEALEIAFNSISKNPKNPPFIIVKSWNEWAEGNYLEPDQKYGKQWLRAIHQVRKKY